MTVADLRELLDSLPDTATVLALVRDAYGESIPFEIEDVTYNHGEALIMVGNEEEDTDE